MGGEVGGEGEGGMGDEIGGGERRGREEGRKGTEEKLPRDMHRVSAYK